MMDLLCVNIIVSHRALRKRLLNCVDIFFVGVVNALTFCYSIILMAVKVKGQINT